MADPLRARVRQMLSGKRYGLISCLSFEERCLAVARELGSETVSWLSIENEDIETDIGKMRDEAARLVGGNVRREFRASKKRPLKTADTVFAILQGAFRDELSWVIDITTMTHEIVLIILSALEYLSVERKRVLFAYNLAKEYSWNETDLSKKWVSRGIQDLRSVVGFSGAWVPGEESTLVALPGFDLERVAWIADELEPESIWVGIGLTERPDNRWMAESNGVVGRQLVARRGGGTFNYDCLSPVATARAVMEVCDATRGNIVVAALNNKVSTLGVGLAALRRERWQLCYAPALVYNIHYARASEEFLLYGYDLIANEVAREAQLAEAF